MVLLTQLPPEIVNHVLSFVDPEDLPRVNTTCQYLYHAVKDNKALFRAVYLRHLDAPPPDAQLSWVQEIQDLVKLKRICASEGPERLRATSLFTDRSQGGILPGGQSDHLPFVYNTVTRLLQHATSQGARPRPSVTYGASQNVSILRECFSSESTVHAFLCRSFLFQRARTPVKKFSFPKQPPEERQMSAKLHCLYGAPVLNFSRLRSSRTHPFAISKVYDIREYTTPDAMGYVPEPRNRDIADLELEDPYGVTGTWLRVVCFLDYNDFFAYNFPPHDDLPNHLPRHALDEVEATRLIVVKIRVTRIEPPGPEDGQALPVVHFEGFSKSLDSSLDENANSGLTGSVRLTREGEVRWTSHSIFNGQERWRSESIQVGGLRSAKVVGNWFDKDYDPSGPVGPTAFWKISDRQPGSRDDHITENDYRAIIDGLEEDVDLGPADDDDDAGLLGVFQINYDDEEYEFGEEEEEDDDDDGSEEDDLGSGDAAGDMTGGEEQDGDDDTFIFAGVTSHGLDEK
ncbi:hypothetical protein INS49_000530 [Diaporthe citri]|uniref:uncharacterized protein n=1 Tax=Diaporthe citri TaxID=83186 RepID=UPI001C7FB816|nr:uncharacterized protein INS49_000530 [Diaporthe citri]KAG6366353.1 hypothetical protein INS49_000530 [Diaporthe citri]